MKKNLLILATIFISPASFCSQVTISNTSKSGPERINISGHLNSSANAPVTFTASQSLTAPDEKDTNAYNCLETDLRIDDGGRVHQAIHLGDTLDASVSGDLSVTGTVKNKCSTPLKTTLWLYDVIQGKVSGYHYTLDLSDTSTCSVVVNTSPEFENIEPDTENNILPLTFSENGKGTLSFSPGSSSSGYGQLKNGDSTIPYSVTGATWDEEESVWTGDLKDHDLQLGKIPQSTKSGKYIGNLTVTIACE